MNYLWDQLVSQFIGLTETNLVPDAVTRRGMRYLIGQRLAAFRANGVETQEVLEQAFIDALKRRAIAEATSDANEQHYEVPTEFYRLCLGPRLKYSSAYYPAPASSLADAENAMFALYAQRAELSDGQTILDCGCGWGSLTLYLAEKYPNSTIYALSNSRTQKEFIDAQANERGFKNITVITGDINDFDFARANVPGAGVGVIDRVLSIEMFEHMKNYEALLARISRWLRPDGKLFVHIFTFAHHSYHFEVAGPSDWMTKYFFAGGTMPCANLLMRFQRDMVLQKHWKVNGKHYARTCEHWLVNMDANTPKVREVFAKAYGEKNVTCWIARWRMFYMACAELFNFDDGNQWFVSHYLFTPRPMEGSKSE